MPFIPHTPESLIRRSDSKNPATTCKGITTTGRNCRRDLASLRSSPGFKSGSKNGVLAVLQPNGEDHEGAAAYFCWQHKDQAVTLASADQSGRKADILPLERRTSIDTLAERLGVFEIEDNESPLKEKRRRQHARPARKETLPRKWQDVEGPLLAVPDRRSRPAEKPARPAAQLERRGGSNFGFSIFCCVPPAEPEPGPPARVKKNHEKPEHGYTERSKMPSHAAPHTTQHNHQRPRPQLITPAAQPPTSPTPTPKPHPLPQPRPHPPGPRTSSHTQTLLSLIPPYLTPQTTSLLLAELAKPLPPTSEPGYIYIFWLTPTTHPPPTTTAASSLLSPTPTTTTTPPKTPAPATILLKIGRASNIQRRLNEWTRQCNHNLTLLRYYPHHSSPSPSTPRPLSPRKLPHPHKVERLIHLELADKRAKRDCGTCGREHREWFEVEGTREGVRGVESVVGRWVGWGEGVGVGGVGGRGAV